VEQGEPTDCRGKKTLICAVRVSYEPHSSLYVCAECTKDEKKSRGCKRNRRKPTGKIKCVCGRSKACNVCRGSGEILLKKCIRALSKTITSSSTLPYFFHWKATGFMAYPDGRGRMYQPAKLLEAFSVCHSVAARCEEEEMARAMNRKNHG
jgi:hypothetical protein